MFYVEGKVFRDLVRFSSVYGVGLLLQAALLSLLVEVVEDPVLAAQPLAIGMMAIYGFFANRYFSFRRNDTEPVPPLASAGPRD